MWVFGRCVIMIYRSIHVKANITFLGICYYYYYYYYWFIMIIIIISFQEDNIFGTNASLTYGPQMQTYMRLIITKQWKLFTVCTEQVMSPYIEHAASWLPNPCLFIYFTQPYSLVNNNNNNNKKEKKKKKKKKTSVEKEVSRTVSISPRSHGSI